MWLGVISLLPEMFDAVSNDGVFGRALASGRLTLNRYNPRDFTKDKHRTVDDRPYGGGPGMVMMVEPLRQALAAAKADAPADTKVVLMSPQGKRFDQGLALTEAAAPGLILICGRYEGIDERVIQSLVDQEWSVGDYVLSGGELPAMIMMDAITRLIPGVLGHEASAQEDSFTGGLLDCPHYTRPEVLNGEAVPSVLLSGNHEKIRQWRLKQSLGRTWQRRPELLNDLALTEEQQRLLSEYQIEQLQQDDS